MRINSPWDGRTGTSRARTMRVIALVPNAPHAAATVDQNLHCHRGLRLLLFFPFFHNFTAAVLLLVV